MPARVIVAVLALLLSAGGTRAGAQGYYRQPALHGGTLVFVAEGDLWSVSAAGGTAHRLTSHPAEETSPAISPDGSTVAFVASYEGPAEVYTIPLTGGRPTRRTFVGGGRIDVAGWAPDGRIVVASDRDAGLPDVRLTLVRCVGDRTEIEKVPLAQASAGSFDERMTLFFTRLPFQGSHTKRYQGGTAQNIWRFAPQDREATLLTGDWPGTSERPMWWNGRVYFVTDRDGTRNVWSMRPDGTDRLPHTAHAGWDVLGASLHDGRIAYQLGADLRILDLRTGEDRPVPIVLESDFDQTREQWIERPMDYLGAAHASPDGERVVLTARGRVFVAPRRQGRLVEAVRQEGVRYRDARFLPDGKGLVALSDASGEIELWRLPADGVGRPEPLTTDGTVLRWEGIPSPDGRYIAHHDKDQRLFLLDTRTRRNRLVEESAIDGFSDLAWSPDSRYLAYVAAAENGFRKIRIHGLAEKESFDATTDRFDSFDPAWSKDGRGLYFLSDRNLETIADGPWGTYGQEPYLSRTTRIYLLALTAGQRSPFSPRDELHSGEEGDPDTSCPPEKDEKKGGDAPERERRDEGDGDAGGGDDPPACTPGQVRVRIERQGLTSRLFELPVPPGNYADLQATAKALFWLSTPTGERRTSVVGVWIRREDVQVETVMEDVRAFELTANLERLLVRRNDAVFVIDAVPCRAGNLDRVRVDLGGWTLSVQPREEWRQMFDEAWRLERDYFYDPGMHGVDWAAMRAKYRPLVDRVTTRQELSDVLAQMVSELSALHTFVRGGDRRVGDDQVHPGSLGAELVRDERAGGYRVASIHRSDPDEPARTAPLARPEADVREGDVLTAINGTPILSAADPSLLLRNQAGRQVLLSVRPHGGGPERSVIVTPITADQDADLRYHAWEYARRLQVEEQGGGRIGYLHLRAMGKGDYTSWAKGYFPVSTREGLIVDARHNRGGNIDSWILGRLLRKPWAYWSQRVGASPTWNFQRGFAGHVVILCDEQTASDGELLCEGIRRLGLGTVVGTRTWGGEIWLTSSNALVDNGIATAAEFGVYGPEGSWLIEGHGVEPDVVVDNLPHETWKGRDAQLEAAIEILQRKMAEKPVARVPAPRPPDKSGHGTARPGLEGKAAPIPAVPAAPVPPGRTEPAPTDTSGAR